MDISINKTNEAKSAYKVAEHLPDYFDQNGLASIKKDAQKQILYGAYKDGQMIGFVTYQKINDKVVELTWMGVLPKYQGEGVGTSLVLESLKELTEYKVCEVKTVSEEETDEGYARTRKFYEKLGFIPLESINPYPGWNDPCQIYVKCLKH